MDSSGNDNGWRRQDCNGRQQQDCNGWQQQRWATTVAQWAADSGAIAMSNKMVAVQDDCRQSRSSAVGVWYF
jgi:hypothetical protein